MTSFYTGIQIRVAAEFFLETCQKEIQWHEELQELLAQWDNRPSIADVNCIDYQKQLCMPSSEITNTFTCAVQVCAGITDSCLFKRPCMQQLDDIDAYLMEVSERLTRSAIQLFAEKSNL